MRAPRVIGAALLTLGAGVYADAPRVRVTRPRPGPTAGGCALTAHTRWEGRYQCAQGETALTLRVLGFAGDTLRAEFVFHHGPSGAAGRYTLRGRCAGDAVALSPEAWVARPPGYIMVGLHGRVTEPLFSGQIEHPSCGAFQVEGR
ncbi:MAG: hypothetical protein JNK72_07445 [Myxococcales bacterium]|nr:hypothetical protein [Myxococcales bacterium]